MEAAGGFAAVLNKGERDGGTILVICAERGGNRRLFERVPSAEGHREWQLNRHEDAENKSEFDEYLARRKGQDPDLWMIELDIANGERFIGLT